MPVQRAERKKTPQRARKASHQVGTFLKLSGSAIIYMICCYLESRESEGGSEKEASCPDVSTVRSCVTHDM